MKFVKNINAMLLLSLVCSNLSVAAQHTNESLVHSQNLHQSCCKIAENALINADVSKYNIGNNVLLGFLVTTHEKGDQIDIFVDKSLSCFQLLHLDHSMFQKNDGVLVVSKQKFDNALTKDHCLKVHGFCKNSDTKKKVQQQFDILQSTPSKSSKTHSQDLLSEKLQSIPNQPTNAHSQDLLDYNLPTYSTPAELAKNNTIRTHELGQVFNVYNTPGDGSCGLYALRGITSAQNNDAIRRSIAQLRTNLLDWLKSNLDYEIELQNGSKESLLNILFQDIQYANANKVLDLLTQEKKHQDVLKHIESFRGSEHLNFIILTHCYPAFMKDTYDQDIYVSLIRKSRPSGKLIKEDEDADFSGTLPVSNNKLTIYVYHTGGIHYEACLPA